MGLQKSPGSFTIGFQVLSFLNLLGVQWKREKGFLRPNRPSAEGVHVARGQVKVTRAPLFLESNSPASLID